jgi:hypothetical protein
MPPESTAQPNPADATPPGTPSDPAGTTENSSAEPTMTFQERIEMERRRKDQEPSLF